MGDQLGGGGGECVDDDVFGVGGSGEGLKAGRGGGGAAAGEGSAASTGASEVAGGGVCCKGGISDVLSFLLRQLETRTGGGKRDKDLIQLENALNIN